MAQAIFADNNVQITARGQWHLGAALGSRDFAKECVAAKIEFWFTEVSALARVASNCPHAAYCALRMEWWVVRFT